MVLILPDSRVQNVQSAGLLPEAETHGECTWYVVGFNCAYLFVESVSPYIHYALKIPLFTAELVHF